MLLKKGSL